MSQGSLAITCPAPPQADALFQLVFSARPDAAIPPDTAQLNAVAGQVAIYTGYVQQFVQAMQAESLRLAATAEDENALEQLAGQLLHFENRRCELLAPYLSGVQGAGGGAPLLALRGRLQDGMARELEAIRDARLRLELRKAELVNRRASPHVRIVLRGAGQIRLFFAQADGHSIQKN